MIPICRKVLNSRYAINIDLSVIPTTASAAKISGSVKKLGQQYSDALIVLFSKDSLQPIAVHNPNLSGDYRFLGLNTDLKTFIVAFDRNQQFNAVIQDNVVPK